MNVVRTDIPDVVIIEPKVFADDRGYLFESWSQRVFDEQVRHVHFVQDNESKSKYGVIRAFHYQTGDNAQGKLVRVVQGKVLDVAVDVRKGSPTFGKHVSVELSGENKRQLFIPRGFAHGFAALSDEVIFQFKCDNYYAPQSEVAIAWDDPDIGVNWQLPTSDILIAPKDMHNLRFADLTELFDYSIDYYHK